LPCFFLLTFIRNVTNAALLPVDITVYEIQPLKFDSGQSFAVGQVDGLTVAAFVTFIFAIPTPPLHLKMQFVICPIVVCRDISVSSSDLWLLECHF
jgi:hypothetical protein